MNEKQKNISILILLICLLLSSFGGIGYYVHQKRVDQKNQEIMVSEIKNSIMDRNYKKAYSIVKMLKEKYSNNQDINLLEKTLSQLANNNPFESKEEQRETAKKILSKIQGTTDKATESREIQDIDLTFNNRYIKDNIKMENYSNRDENIKIEDTEIEDFIKDKTPKKLIIEKEKNVNKLMKKDKAIDITSNVNNDSLSTNERESQINQNDSINLNRIKDNLTKKINENSKKTPINDLPIVTNKPKTENNNTQKNTIVEVPKTKQIPTVKLPILKINDLNTNSITNIITRPYNYKVKKELYEILDNINTGKTKLGKNRLDNMISKGLSNKFKQVSKLIDNENENEAANMILNLIKKDIEPNLKHTPPIQVPVNNAALKAQQDTTAKKANDLNYSSKKVETIKSLEDFLKTNSTDSNTLRLLAKAYEKKSDLQKTEKTYMELVKLTNDPKDYYQLGITRFKLKKYQTSLEAFSKTTELDPSNKKAYNNKGINLIALNKNNEAINEFNNAIKIDPNYDTAYYQKGVAYEKNNDSKNAFENFKQAFELNPKGNYALKAGIMANDLKDFNNAEKYLTNSIRSYKDENDLLFYNLGIAKLENDKLLEALDFAQKAVNMNPQSEDYLYLQASIYLKNKNYNKAIEIYSNVINKNPDNITAHINIANAYDNLGDLTNAAKTLEKIVYKNNAIALNNLGIIYKKQKAYSQAINILNKAVDLNYNEARYSLGMTYFEMKINKEATKILNDYVKLNPNNPDALYALGIIEFNDNKNDTVLTSLIVKYPNYSKVTEIKRLLKK